MTDIIFSDFKKDLSIHPLKRDLLRLTNEEAVKESVKNIVFTGKYERYRRPSFGAGIPQDLFENISPSTEYEVKTRITEAINNYEPRANLISVIVVANNDHNNYSVTIVFKTVNSFEPITLSNILRRIR